MAQGFPAQGDRKLLRVLMEDRIKPTSDLKKIDAGLIAAWLIPLALFWLVLQLKPSATFTQYFHRFSFGLFLLVLILYYFCFRLRWKYAMPMGFGITMLLFALALAYMWGSGFSDNFITGGLLPYKDAKNFYAAADLILNGRGLKYAGQAVGRPLFPGFLSSLLVFTGHNLKLSMAILAQLCGIGLYLSVRQVRGSFGALGAGLYITFLYFYMQPRVGYTMSEQMGFMLGCMAFGLLWSAVHNLNWFDLVLGLITLMAAVSARAGTFFIFPSLILVVGHIFRGLGRFSMKAAWVAAVTLVLGYFLFNTIYPRLLGVREGASFSNFAYSLYGQVRGGIGWHNAIVESGTRNTDVIYRAALDYFMAHPLDFFRGAGRSYLDFFSPGTSSIFEFGMNPNEIRPGLLMWGAALALLVFGLRNAITGFHNMPGSKLLLAGAAGFLLSIPFLPPIDGGNRFYASTTPFFFALLAFGARGFIEGKDQEWAGNPGLSLTRAGAAVLLGLAVLLPPVTLRVQDHPNYDLPACPVKQRPFVIRVNPDSHIDLVNSGSGTCGFLPEVCLEDFWNNNSERLSDGFYQELHALTVASGTGITIQPATNLIDGSFLYFVDDREDESFQLPGSLLSGCAIRIATTDQTILLIDSLIEFDG